MDPAPKPDQPKPELTDEYAQSLLRTTTQEYQQNRAQIPTQKHFISKKTLIILAVSTLITVLAMIVASHLLSTKGKPTSQTNQGTQIINSAENFNNPNAY